MNFDLLRELNDLFEYRHDALILLCLSRGVREANGQPLHFRELARSIIRQTGMYIGESNISRSLPRLKDTELVAVYGEGTRHPSYRPTPLGEQKAALLAFIVEAIENRHNEEPPNSDEDKEDPERDT